MNFIEFESKEKLRGGFYTEPAIARFLTKWVGVQKPTSVLEPSCGDGAFLAALEELRIESLRRITACELDPQESERAAGRTRLPAQILNTDFLKWFLFSAQYEEGFDAVVGNPPFIRYQYLPSEQQLLSEKIFGQLHLPFTKHTNAWVPFVLASINLLRPGGRLAMVVPSEIFHIPHAQSLRRYLVEQCSRILILDPEEIWFAETLQGTVLLLAEKKQFQEERERGLAVISVKSRQLLEGNPEDLFQSAEYVSGVTIEGKWMPVLLSPAERVLLSEIRTLPAIKRFADVASVDVGIVTGANKFFLVPEATVADFELQEWAHPMFGRSEHVKGLVYSEADHEANKEAGLPANFLWFQVDQIEELPSNVRAYLKTGLAQKLHTRFKCRTRKSWFRVPSVYSAPVAMLKRAHHYPRLVLNTANAYTTDTAYRICPLSMESESLVLGFVNSVTCLSAELEGRHYGGGVLELVPSEIERLLVPEISGSRAELEMADAKFRGSKSDTEFLRHQDSLILGRIGIAKRDQALLHSAWARLRDRRHRVPETEGQALLRTAV